MSTLRHLLNSMLPTLLRECAANLTRKANESSMGAIGRARYVQDIAAYANCLIKGTLVLIVLISLTGCAAEITTTTQSTPLRSSDLPDTPSYTIEQANSENWRSAESQLWPPPKTSRLIELGFGKSQTQLTDRTRSVEVYYVSTREKELHEPSGKLFYGSKRAEKASFGIAYVSIPPTHRLGDIERPYVWFSAETPSRHFVLTRVLDTGHEFFFTALRTRASASKINKVLLFVHGHNTRFDDALYRAAQIKNDIAFPGPVVVYSWPTSSTSIGYLKTGASLDSNIASLASSIKGLLQLDSITDLVLLSHSAGAKLCAEALKDSYSWPQSKKLKSAIFASPDIDRLTFVQDIAPRLEKLVDRSTIYASSSDRALALSEYLSDALRLGKAVHLPLPQSNIELVDTTAVATGFLGHADFAESPKAINDLSLIVNHTLEAERRPGLKRVQPSVWRINP